MIDGSGLAARLRNATWATHRQAAGDTFLKSLLRGEGTVHDYARLASQHLVIYRALETAVATCEDGLVVRLHDRALERTSAIEADLAALGGAREATAPTREYARHLASLDSDPVRLAAHHYTRYLGDLSGGQHIGRALARHFGETTTHFYRFDLDADAFKQRYRSTLDAALLDAEAERVLLDEVGRAYAYAHGMHAALAPAAAPAAVAAA